MSRLLQVATSSGNSTVKIWDVAKEKCKHTLTDHTQFATQIRPQRAHGHMMTCVTEAGVGLLLP